MIGALFSLVSDYSWIGAIVGGAGTVLSAITRGAWKWVILAVAVALIGFYIMGLKLTIAHQETKIATMTAVIDKATVDIRLAERTNGEALATLDRLAQHHAADLAAITADRDRIATAAKSVKIIKEKVYVTATQCVGIPPAGRLIADWVLSNPDPAGSR